MIEPQLLSKLGSGKTHTASLAKHIYAARAERAKFLGADLFGEPAWDILLSLYVAEHEDRRMKISAACNESGVPASTALRWIERLIELKLLKRFQNHLDSRSSFVELTEEGLQKMEQVLERTWAEHFPVD